MQQELSIFDFLPEDEAEQFKPKKSTDWKWSMANDYPKEKNGLKVFSCFACGGGSTMGYKLAGCEVIGCCEIDPKMNEVYKKNHNPKHNFLMDIREFNKIPNEELPEELFNLDILDGSPPCTTFSMAGEREESWGKKKKFREGQAEQTLDDLSFVFNETVAKLKPKCVIMENVEGLIKGEAWSYVQQIYKQLNDIGYKVKHWLLKGQYMGVPQTRHRVFFIALRNDVDFDLERLDMSFNYEPVTYGEIKEGTMKPLGEGTDYRRLTLAALPHEKCIADVNIRLHNKNSGFQSYFVDDDSIIPTQRAKPDIIDRNAVAYISKETIRNAQTFPQDYDFGNDTYSAVGYICGMSVPPIMIKRIVTRLIESGVFYGKSNH
jgi:DNA (cytosine-5)-methyltransferase 1